MGLAVVTVASGGLPVVEVTAYGLAVTEATNARGIAVTKVTGGKPGLPVTFVSESGGPVVVTYTTFNPADLAAITLSGGNLTATGTAALGGVRAIKSVSSGKYYFEEKISAISSNALGAGLATAAVNLTTITASTVGVTAMNRVGNVFVNAVNTGITFGIRAVNDVIGIAADLGAKLIWFRVAPAGNWNASATANPATGTEGISFSALGTPLFPVFISGGVGDAGVANFGTTAFSGAVPAGFTSGISS